MAPTNVAVRPRRSAFAAAFLSFIFPGLGHAYLGRWLRALLWAALPIIGIAAVAGLGVSMGWRDLAAQLFDPDVLTGVLLILVLDFFYRLFAMLDAYRLASDPTVGSGSTRLMSSAGLVALIVVLAGSHVALAQPVFLASDTIRDITGNAGDDSEVVSAEDLATLGEDWRLITEEQFEQGDPEPGVSPAASPLTSGSTPTSAPATPEPTPEATPDPTELPEWDGKKRLNILLIGSDGGRQGRLANSQLTDTMIVVSVDPVTGRLAFISLPRDATGIPLPRAWPAYNALGGKWNNKINTLYAQARGNPGLFPGNDKQRGYMALMGALGELYGLDIDYYVAVDLNSFRAVVNTLGGVVVDVQLPVYDTDYATGDGRGSLKLYVAPGMTRMNGQQALAYARSRHGSSDFDRSARQQRIITSVRGQTDIDSLLEPGVLTELIAELRKDVKTNIPPKLVPSMLSLAQSVNLDRRENLVLSSSRYVETCYPCGSLGLWMLKVNPAAIKDAVNNVFSTSKQQALEINRIEDEGAVVHVINGTRRPNNKTVNIAGHLAGKGIGAIVPAVGGGRAESRDHEATHITVYNGAEERMPKTFRKIKNSLKDKGRQVEFVDDPDAAADFVITVGQDTKALKP